MKSCTLSTNHPHDTAQRNQEADDGFDQQHRRRQTAPPPAANPSDSASAAGAAHRSSWRRAAADIGRQFGEDNHTQYQNDDEERITPILFLDTSHPPTRLSSGIKSKECAGFPATGTKRHATPVCVRTQKKDRPLKTDGSFPRLAVLRRHPAGDAIIQDCDRKGIRPTAGDLRARKLRPYTSPYFQRSRARLPIRRIRFVHAPPGESFRCRRS